MVLGFNPRSTIEWKGQRPTKRMGAMAILLEIYSKQGNFKTLLISIRIRFR